MLVSIWTKNFKRIPLNITLHAFETHFRKYTRWWWLHVLLQEGGLRKSGTGAASVQAEQGWIHLYIPRQSLETSPFLLALFSMAHTDALKELMSSIQYKKGKNSSLCNLQKWKNLFLTMNQSVEKKAVEAPSEYNTTKTHLKGFWHVKAYECAN